MGADSRHKALRVCIQSLGCKVNQAEMASVEHTLKSNGHEIVSLKGRPDVCVINTCSVTSKSDYLSRQMIRKAERAGARVVVTGCYSELNPVDVSKMQGVEKVLSNPDKSNIISYLDSTIESNNIIREGSRSRYFLKVQDGCAHSCTYCIIWKARGKPKSVPIPEVVAQIREASALGYQEVVITGIHLGLYGTDMDMPDGFERLVEAILRDTDIARIRLSSLEINEISDKLLELMQNDRVCRHLHIPLQSGDNGVLRDMNRFYNTEFFSERMLEIARALPGISIGTDIIAGFPSESIEAFDKAVSFIKAMPFTYLHVFGYSPRSGTPAADMKDEVGAQERKRRVAVLRELSVVIKRAYMVAQIDSDNVVLVESIDSSGFWSGTTSNYLKLQCSGGSPSKGTLIPVRISGVDNDALVGELYGLL
jgi:threonylcarbamoyladenosine tRNA methylthiotransferase MtaB